MSRHTDEEIERTRAAVIEAAREQALQAKADAVRIKARNKADNIRRKAETKAKLAIAKGEARAAKLEGIAPAEVLAQGAALKWACAVFMVCSLVLFANSAAYHLGDWSPRVTDVLRRIDHLNIFLLIAGTYTPASFALEPFWRNAIIGGMWACTSVAMIVHVIWISAPRWLYTITYIVFGVSGVAFMWLFWVSPYAGPPVVILLAAGGACYIAGAIVYALRKPDPWPRVFGFHEIFHCGTVAGYACQMVAIYMVIVSLWQ